MLFNNNTSFRYPDTSSVGSFMIFLPFYDKLQTSNIYCSNVCCIVDSCAVEFFIKFEYTMCR